MKYVRISLIIFFIAVFAIPCLYAQENELSLDPLSAMSFNGSTGLFSIPTGRIGWEKDRDLGLDLGYHAIIKKDRATHIPKIALSFFKLVELSTAVDIQPDYYITEEKGADFVGGLKIHFPIKKTALALGGNFQALNMFNERENRYSAGQVYLAVSYAGNFFNWPAETTIVMGKTFQEGYMNSDIDFGMGFDLALWPKVFRGYIHWITDFSNFSYSVEAFHADSWYRGVLNTGLRLNFAMIPFLKKFKFSVDIVMTDAFDKNRAFSVGGMFGIPII